MSVALLVSSHLRHAMMTFHACRYGSRCYSATMGPCSINCWADQGNGLRHVSLSDPYSPPPQHLTTAPVRSQLVVVLGDQLCILDAVAGCHHRHLHHLWAAAQEG
jgi:hypothetical protein